MQSKGRYSCASGTRLDWEDPEELDEILWHKKMFQKLSVIQRLKGSGG